MHDGSDLMHYDATCLTYLQNEYTTSFCQAIWPPICCSACMRLVWILCKLPLLERRKVQFERTGGVLHWSQSYAQETTKEEHVPQRTRPNLVRGVGYVTSWRMTSHHSLRSAATMTQIMPFEVTSRAVEFAVVLQGHAPSPAVLGTIKIKHVARTHALRKVYIRSSPHDSYPQQASARTRALRASQSQAQKTAR